MFRHFQSRVASTHTHDWGRPKPSAGGNPKEVLVKTLYSETHRLAATDHHHQPRNTSAYEDAFCHFRLGRPLITSLQRYVGLDCGESEKKKKEKRNQRNSLGVKAHPTLMCSIPRRAAGVNGSRVTSLCWWLMPLLKHPLVWQQRQLSNTGVPSVLTTACRFIGKEPGTLLCWT